MIVTVEVLWPMNMRIMISYCHNVILSTGSLIDDCDSGSVMVNEYENVNRLLSRHEVLWPMKMRLLTSCGHCMKCHAP